MSLRIGVATLHAGRRAQLEGQAAAVTRLRDVERYVAVAMDGSGPPPGAESLQVRPTRAGRLPLARARNAAISALADSCDLVVLLDADCLPDTDLIKRFRTAAASIDLTRGLMLGEVGWLDAIVRSGRLSRSRRAAARRTAKRGFPPHGLAPEPRPELFWSLCFAVAPAAHARIGGFDEGFTGWGAEDTDYGRRAAAAGVELWKVGGAWSYHQPHPAARRSHEEVAAVLDNARRFQARWGDWPMPDVLAELAAEGHVARRPITDAGSGGDGQNPRCRRISTVAPLRRRG